MDNVGTLLTLKAGLNGGFKSMGDRMVDENGVLGMVKYAASSSCRVTTLFPSIV